MCTAQSACNEVGHLCRRTGRGREPRGLRDIASHGLGAFEKRSVTVEESISRNRNVEKEKDRKDRLKEEAERALDDCAAAEDAVDAMIRRSIKLHGP